MNLNCRLCVIFVRYFGEIAWTFLGIFSFLVSEDIPQLLFEFEENSGLPEDLEFCTDEFKYDWCLKTKSSANNERSFSEATESLLTLP